MSDQEFFSEVESLQAIFLCPALGEARQIKRAMQAFYIARMSQGLLLLFLQA